MQISLLCRLTDNGWILPSLASIQSAVDFKVQEENVTQICIIGKNILTSPSNNNGYSPFIQYQNLENGDQLRL